MTFDPKSTTTDDKAEFKLCAVEFRHRYLAHLDILPIFKVTSKVKVI